MAFTVCRKLEGLFIKICSVVNIRNLVKGINNRNSLK